MPSGVKKDNSTEEESGIDSAVRIVIDRLEATGLDIGLNNEGINSLVLAERHSEFNEDSRLIEQGSFHVLSTIALEHGEYNLTKRQIAESRFAALIHDIRKVGPVEATPRQQQAILKIFAVKGKKDPLMSVEDMVRENLGEEANEIFYDLGDCLDTSMAMRQFYSSHAKWGAEFLTQKCPEIPEVIVKIAALHHMDRTDGDFTFGIDLGHNLADIIRQRVLMAIDQYQARIYRGKVGHEEAVEWVRKNTSEKFGDDPHLRLVLDTMLKMGQEKIFSNVLR